MNKKQSRRTTEPFHPPRRRPWQTSPDPRKPLLWLAKGREDDGERYLVNATGETLDQVIADVGGCITVDDDALPVTSESPYTYRNVANGEAVKVEHFDGYYDLDYLLQIVLEIQSPTLGRVIILTPPEKGGVGELVLLWEDGAAGRHVSIKEIASD
ncbi:MAG: hypothetical protein WEB57_00505 [Pseudohongiellaceae bacterium]